MNEVEYRASEGGYRIKMGSVHSEEVENWFSRTIWHQMLSYMKTKSSNLMLPPVRIEPGIILVLHLPD